MVLPLKSSTNKSNESSLCIVATEVCNNKVSLCLHVSRKKKRKSDIKTLVPFQTGALKEFSAELIIVFQCCIFLSKWKHLSNSL